MTDPRARQVGGDHYLNLGIQPWDAMRAWMSPAEFQGFLRGNVIKYVARFDAKGGIEDLRKAMHYLETLIAERARAQASPTPPNPNPQEPPVMQQLQIPPLAEGEVYLGVVGDQLGNVEHIIQLPGDNDDAPWADQMAWAQSIGGDLPTRVEMALIWERNRAQMKKDCYWIGEAHHKDSSYAWYQNFHDGDQVNTHKSAQLRAVAVRRLPI